MTGRTFIRGSGDPEAPCQSGTGTDVTLSETGAVEGQLLTVVSIGSQSCNMLDSAGVAEIGGGDVLLSQYDAMTFIYMSDRWIRLSTADN